MVRVTIVIDDQKWPKLRMVVTREGLNGAKAATTVESTYDTAYTVFEAPVHNMLRPAVAEIVERRMPKAVLR